MRAGAVNRPPSPSCGRLGRDCVSRAEGIEDYRLPGWRDEDGYLTTPGTESWTSTEWLSG